MKINERVKRVVRNWLEIEEIGTNNFITIRDLDNIQTQLFKNEIWYRGIPSELHQFYTQYNDGVKNTDFWASVASTGIDFRKIHTGLPALIIDMLVDIVVDDMNDIVVKVKNDVESIEDEEVSERWKEIAKEHDFKDNTVKEAVKEALLGDCVFKLAYDPDISQYPIIEVISGKNVEYIYERGRIKEFKFLFPKKRDKQVYALEERYYKGGVEYKVFDEESREITVPAIEDEEGLHPFSYDDSFILAVPFIITKSKRFTGRGKGLLEDKEGALDSYDESWSQWMEALRDGRIKTYIPEDLIPKDRDNGSLYKPNAFDSRYISMRGSKVEGAENKVQVESPEIRSNQYLETYITALDNCLQGVISPSTLGIDVKKLDNAEAQREKEKATLYTRNKIVRKLEKVIPELVSLVLKTDDMLNQREVREYEVSVDFGEYANPSFEAQVETVGLARQNRIMSVETAIEQLYGDSWTEDEKKDEVERLKKEEGIVEEPSVSSFDKQEQTENNPDKEIEQVND